MERLRIYRAARPLILALGVRRTTMAAIGRLAHISPGGIYHYFRSKRRLVLYGLEPEALSRACHDESVALRQALAAGPLPNRATTIIDLYVEKSVRMLDFVRPALHAAIELGRQELHQQLAAGLHEDADFLVSSLTALGMGPVETDDAAHAVRRATLGLALDDVSAVAARRHLHWLFERLIPHSRDHAIGAPARRVPA